MTIVITMSLYILAILGIGLYYSKRSNENSEAFFLGERKMGPFITAMSAEASDMSGWLLMGLPGIAYISGLEISFWTAIGLFLGTYFNWLLVAKRLRVYSKINNSITLSDYFSNRFYDDKKILMSLSALLILIFFTIYTASCFVTIAKLFTHLFNVSYFSMLLLSMILVLSFTIIGGYLAEATSDLMQATLMIFALVIVLILGVYASGGIGQIIENTSKIPNYLNIIPKENGKLSIISTLSWGLGYFGVPQVLIRFMAIRGSDEIKLSRRVATIWVFLSLIFAVAIGIIGRNLFPTLYSTSSDGEKIFIELTKFLVPNYLAGIVMAGILAATFSSAAAYLLISSSAISKNIYQQLIDRNASDKKIMKVSRVTLIVISIIAILMSLDENSVIFNIVSFAWAGFGACFGPILLFSLFYRKTTKEAAVLGMVSGTLMVFIWNILGREFGGIFNLYSLLPSFIFSSIVIYITSKFTKVDERIEKDFNKFKEKIKR